MNKKIRQFLNSEEEITCLECGKQFKQLTWKHLLKHGLGVKDYLIKHNLCRGDIISRNTRILMQNHMFDVRRNNNLPLPIKRYDLKPPRERMKTTNSKVGKIIQKRQEEFYNER